MGYRGINPWVSSLPNPNLVPQYRGEWVSGVRYELADVVLYNNGLYIAHTSGLVDSPELSDKWQAIFSGKNITNLTTYLSNTVNSLATSLQTYSIELANMSATRQLLDAEINRLKSIISTKSIGREPTIGDAAGTYRFNNQDISWDGTTVTAITPALAPQSVLDRVTGNLPIYAADYGVKDESLHGQQDNGQALQAAIDATPFNGTLVLPLGTIPFYSKLTITKPITIVGAGRDKTILRTLDASGIWINIKTDGSCVFRDFSMYATSNDPHRAGSMIKVTGGTPTTMNSGSIFENLSFLSHMSAINFEAAYGYKILNCNFNNLQDNGQSIILNNIVDPDFGDQVIEGCNFHSATGTNTKAIYQLAGGGTRIRNNKFYKHDAAYELLVNAYTKTSILFIEGCSFETQANHAIKLQSTNELGSYYTKITICGNQFNEDVSSIYVNGFDQIAAVDIYNNQFLIGSNGKGIDIQSGFGFNIDSNSFTRIGGVFGTSQGVNLNAAGVRLDDGGNASWKLGQGNKFTNLAINTNV